MEIVKTNLIMATFKTCFFIQPLNFPPSVCSKPISFPVISHFLSIWVFNPFVDDQNCNYDKYNPLPINQQCELCCILRITQDPLSREILSLGLITCSSDFKTAI